MSIFEGIAIFLIGCLIGYMICMTSWVKELCREINDIDIEMARLKAKMKGEDGNDQRDIQR